MDIIKDFIEENPSVLCRCIIKMLLIDKNTVKKKKKKKKQIIETIVPEKALD